MDRLDLIPTTHRAERELLLDVLGDTIGDVRFGSELTADSFLAVVPEKLYPLVWVRLKTHAARLNAPGALMETLEAHYKRNVLLELRRVADLRNIDRALSTAGIDFLVLKGPVLAASVYPDRAARTMIDLDLLIADDRRSRAIEALNTIGYQVMQDFQGGEMPAGDSPPLWREEAGGLVVELHSMLDSLPEEREALAIVLPASRGVSMGHGVVLRTLDPGEFFAHVVVHVSKHHRFEGELRSLLDVALLLRADIGGLDWDSLDAEWQRRGIAEWIALTITLAHLLLRSPIPEIYRKRPPSDEALSIAGEQLWILETDRVPKRVTFTVAGRFPKPVHELVAPTKVPVPSGFPGWRVRAVRQWKRARRVLKAIRQGTMRPGVVAEDVDLFLKRERLFAIMEKKDSAR